MKGCLKTILGASVALMAIVVALVLGIAALAWWIVPSARPMTEAEKGAAHQQAIANVKKAREEEDDSQNSLKAEAKRLRDAIIADEKPGFIQWLLSEGGCSRARFTEDHALEVEMPRILIPTEADARVRGEEIAERWAVRGGGSRVVVTVYYGNEPYAEGVYSGGLHKLYLLKVNALGALIDKKKAEAAAKAAQPTTQP